MRPRFCNKGIGIAVLSMGIGILLSFFIPDAVLVIIEAILLIALGILCYTRK